ncbi:hypothetical protein JQT99_01050 [Sulfitobacter mediterraneus]|uniref:hypothetical protein n=1 Tax=Sulfitobacter mediterraneus TaxID=83219 RepID=UPI00193A2244|nr:hypothetical protein [Sulfitobacter mediterraneus]MBM1321012.1 hypothetical protein [Sulfitobacter mediterraneus]MBM1396246.1 hypothetical protein [Sulfitobacter mediterraneus]MBM1419560.1 hypothetical protein [Sulfitobacter mediterraneus]MBM1431214.1 hypothetical protein [Sulfitobacter mediterraneus]MBM1442873.1 hypothetical protein [Sulfitobacter mediterraneus]
MDQSGIPPSASLSKPPPATAKAPKTLRINANARFEERAGLSFSCQMKMGFARIVTL